MTSQCKWPILFQTLNLGNEIVRLSVQKIDFQDRMVSKHTVYSNPPQASREDQHVTFIKGKP